jgi:alpha-mannosidase
VEEISLRRGDRRVELTVTVRKPGRADPEAVYVAFPFAFREPEVRAEVAGGAMRPGIDQVPSMATDWHSVGRWVRLEEGGRGAAWATLDAPLVQFGEINTGRYLEKLPPRRPAVFSWAMNNYWFTNFPAIQGGEFRFRYAILPFAEGAGSDSEASRFAREMALPLRAAALPPGEGKAPAAESLLRIEPANVSVVALKSADDGKGAILRIAEEDGKEARAVISTPLQVERAERATFLEEPLGAIEVRAGAGGRSEIVVPVPPRGVVTVRLAPLEWN